MIKRILLPVILVAALPTFAIAQSPELEQACVKVAQNFLLTNSLKIGVVQSYPELTPPGARLTYSTDKDEDPADIDDEIECEFEKATAPFGLTRFCISDTCYAPGEQEPENRRRFEEIKALMDRAK